MNLQQERIGAICDQLKLERVATDWSAVAQDVAKDDVSVGDFLERLLTLENEARKQRQRDALMKMATLMEQRG